MSPAPQRPARLVQAASAVLLLVVFAVPVVYIPLHQLMSLLGDPDAVTRELPAAEVHEEAVAAIAHRALDYPGLGELEGTPLAMDRDSMRRVVQSAISERETLRLLRQVYQALWRYQHQAGCRRHDLVVSAVSLRDQVLQALFRHWQQRLDGLPQCSPREQLRLVSGLYRHRHDKEDLRQFLGANLVCEPIGPVKSEILSRIYEHLERIREKRYECVTLFSGEMIEEHGVVARWIGRLQLAEHVFVTHSWAWLLIFLVALLGLAALHHADPWRLLRRVGAALLGAAVALLGVALLCYRIAERSTLQNLAFSAGDPSLRSEAAEGVRLAFYALDRLLDLAAERIFWLGLTTYVLAVIALYRGWWRRGGAGPVRGLGRPGSRRG